MPIKCCRYCVPPERHPGCHGNCKKYLDEKEEWEREKEAERKKRKCRHDIIDIHDTMFSKRRRKKKKSN